MHEVLDKKGADARNQPMAIITLPEFGRGGAEKLIGGMPCGMSQNFGYPTYLHSSCPKGC